MKTRQSSLKLLMIAFPLLSICACKKDNNIRNTSAHPVRNTGNIHNAAKIYDPVFVESGNHKVKVDIGGFYSYTGPGGAYRWDCNSVLMICNITTLNSGIGGNGDWIDDASVTAVNFIKSDESMHFYDNVVKDHTYTVTTPYQIAIFDDENAEAPASMYTVNAGTYDVQEDATAFAIIFKDNR